MKQRLIAFSAAAAAALGMAGDTFAASYASGVRNTGGNNYEFILNEAASNVTINLGGGGSTNLGALAAGRHTFTATGAFDIAVSSSSAAGFNFINDLSGPTPALWTNFDRPGGLAINTNPASPYFGGIYVNQVRQFSDAANSVQVVTGRGRSMGNGIYSLTADRVGVDLSTPARTVPLSDNDVALAKRPGVTVNLNSASSATPGGGGANSFYRIGMDAAGNIIAGDWSDVAGGMKYFTADLTSGGPLLREEIGPTGGVLSDTMDELGAIPLHGSIAGEPQVTGTLGVDLVVSAMDEDLDVDLAIATANDGNSVWRWNVGSTVGNFAEAPELVVGVGSLTTAGSAPGQDSAGAKVFLDLNIGVAANAQYNAQYNKWYLSGARSNGNDSSSLVILTPEGPGGDGKDIVVDWASKQFSIDNGLDGFTDGTAPESLGINDIFRQAHNVAFSPDGSMMYVQRRIVTGSNPYLGANSPLNGKILGIPLDENGIPDIQIDDNGTPGDTTDDFFTNVISITTQGAQGSLGSLSNIKVDAAGNLYFTDNIAERLEYYSLGGSFVATTGSGGTFSIAAVEVLAGDYNGDGTVDAADYTVWRDNPAANGGDGGYLVWANNYGATSGSSSTAVPEPTSVLLCLAGLAGLATRRSRR